MHKIGAQVDIIYWLATKHKNIYEPQAIEVVRSISRKTATGDLSLSLLPHSVGGAFSAFRGPCPAKQRQIHAKMQIGDRLEWSARGWGSQERQQRYIEDRLVVAEPPWLGYALVAGGFFGRGDARQLPQAG